MSTAAVGVVRLWRARRRHTHIDADLHRLRGRWTVTFSRNDRLLVVMDFSSERTARAHARSKLRELQLAGWTEHW